MFEKYGPMPENIATPDYIVFPRPKSLRADSARAIELGDRFVVYLYVFERLVRASSAWQKRLDSLGKTD